MLYLILSSPFILFVIYYVYVYLRRKYINSRRIKLLNSPFPDRWRKLLLSEFPLYKRLPENLQRKLEGHINVFLDEKIILGRSDFEITDTVKIMIAAQACILILNKNNNYYPGFKTILVYPDAYKVSVSHHSGGVHSDAEQSRLGESWYRGPIVLTWKHVLNGAKYDTDGQNVVMHEFAHKLDEQNRVMDGLPILTRSSHYKDWNIVLNEAFKAQQAKASRNKRDIIDSYGATSPVEFFAVVTEAFFEKPTKMKALYPDLFEQFKRYYELDPTEWEA